MNKRPISNLIAGLLLTAGYHAAFAVEPASGATVTASTSTTAATSSTAGAAAASTTAATGSTTGTAATTSSTTAMAPKSVPMCTTAPAGVTGKLAEVEESDKRDAGEGGDKVSEAKTSGTGVVSRGDSNDCITAERETSDDDTDKVVNNLTGGDRDAHNRAIVKRDPVSGVMTVTLPDGRTLTVSPVGKTRHHNSTGTAQMEEDGDGHLRLVSATGDEVTLGATQHDPAELKTRLEAEGYRAVTIADGHVEAKRPDGQRVSLSPDMTVATGTPAVGGKVETGSDDSLQVTYADGVSQKQHASPHDLTDLRTQAQSIGVPSVTLNSDGTLSATVAGGNYRFKMSARLQQGQKSQPGIRTENGKIIVQYRDGTEQEINQVP